MKKELLLLNLFIFYSILPFNGFTQTYSYFKTVQGNNDTWHGGEWYEGYYASSWTGTGTISYSSWGSIGRGTNDGQVYYTCNFPDINTSYILVKVFCVSQEKNSLSSEECNIYAREFDTWSWTSSPISTLVNVSTPSEKWVTISNPLSKKYIQSSDGRFDFILTSDDEYVIDKIEFWYAKPNLVSQNPNINPTTVCAGSSISSSCTIKNYNSPAGSSKLKYYLSDDITLSSDDIYLNYYNIPSLSVGGGTSVSRTLSIPSNISSGNYYILFVADANNDINETTSNDNISYTLITIRSLSTTATSISASKTSICSGETITLSQIGGTLGTGASFRWYKESCGGTNIASGSTINVSPTSTTTYYLRAEGYCNTTSCVNKTITIKSQSSAPTSINADKTSITVGESVTLSQSGGSLGSDASYKWYTGNCGNSFIGSGSTITVSPTATTTYYVLADGDCNTTSCVSRTITVTVSGSTPIANFTANKINITLGETIQFTDQSSNSPTSWSWNFGDGSTSTQQNPSHTYNNAGTYTVTLTASNSYGNDTETKSGYITVGSVPVANFSGTPTGGTEPLTVQFTDQSSNSPTSWSWNFGDGGTSTQQNPSYTYNNAGTYTVTLTASNSYGNNTETKSGYITVGSVPVANFSGTPTGGTEPLTVQFTDQSSNSPTSWSWNFGNGSTSTQQNPSYTYNNAGTYTVTLTAFNSYGNDTETKSGYIDVENTTGIINPDSSNHINIYPNPTNGTLIFESSIELTQIEIYDMLGNITYQTKFKREINISNLIEGIYLLKLYNKEKKIVLVKKIILK